MVHFARDMLGFGSFFDVGGGKRVSKNMFFDTNSMSLTRFDTKSLHENDGFDF